MASGNFSPDSLAKRLFVITLAAVIVYLAAVALMLSSGDKADSDTPDFGITTAMVQ